MAKSAAVRKIKTSPAIRDTAANDNAVADAPANDSEVKEAAKASPSKFEMLGGTGEGSRGVPVPVRDTARIVAQINVLLDQIRNLEFDKADKLLSALIANEPVRSEEIVKFGHDTEAFFVDAKHALSDSKKGTKKEERFMALLKKRAITLDDLFEIVGHYGAEENALLDDLLSSKKLMHKKKAYRLLRYRRAAGASFIKIEGFEHVQFLENENNRGWIPLTKKDVSDVLEKQEMKAVKKIEAGVAQSPQELVAFIVSLRDKKVLPELIRKELMEKKPLIRVENVTARANYYLEKAGEPLVHFEGYPKNLWATLDPASLNTAVLLSSRLVVLNAELERTKPYDIRSIEHIVAKTTPTKQDLNERLIDQIPTFTQGAITQSDAELLKLAHRLLRRT
ncbi:hypothetical protein HY772_01740 [Candidatus Woesearchaeota archaeon]|nr:hypothetical protein [Candidatus Woesearchaeota archaeon]